MVGIWEGANNPLTGQPFSERYWGLQPAEKELPMRQPHVQAELFGLLDKHPVLVLAAGTGTGKTTGIGGLLLEYSHQRHGSFANIVCTQPRRNATRNIAERVAQLLDVELGKEVGYQYKENRRFDDSTKFRFVTEGTLWMQMLTDPTIADIGFVVIDEVHERNIETDMVLFFLRQLVISGLRPDFRVVIMSATIDPFKIRRYFRSAGIQRVPGRAFEVLRRYAPRSEKDFVGQTVRSIQRICADPASLPGDVLVFLPSKANIAEACKQLSKTALKQVVVCLAMHAKVSEAEQDEVQNMPASHWGADRKVVMSSNIAEASVTIQGVVYVIDSGLLQEAGFDPVAGCPTLDTTWVSQASVEQRVGRAGRTQPGIALLLYSEAQHAGLRRFQEPAILKSDLAPILLGLLGVGGADTAFEVKSRILDNLLDPPDLANIDSSAKRLAALGALDAELRVTAMGQAMALLRASSPEMARAVVFSRAFDCRRWVLAAAAMAAVGEEGAKSFFRTKEALAAGSLREGGLATMLQLWTQYQAAGKEDRPAFCEQNGVHESKMRDAFKAYRKLQRACAELPEEAGPYPNTQGELAVAIPFSREAWMTTSLDDGAAEDAPLDCVVRCLLHGHFPMLALTDGKSSALHLPGSRTPADASGLAVGSRWVLSTGLTRINGKYQLTSATCVADPVWVFEAGRHFLPHAVAGRKEDAAALQAAEERYYRAREPVARWPKKRKMKTRRVRSGLKGL